MVRPPLARGPTWVLAAAACAVVAVSSASGARAQAVSSDESRARALFEDGRAAYAAGNFELALESFQASYDLSHRPVLLYNLGNVLDRLRRDEEAIDAYEAYLRAIPDAQNRALVLERLEILRSSVAQRQAANPRVPTPEQVARAELAAEPGAAPEQRDDGATRPLYRKWWLWAGIGAGIAAAAVVSALVISNREPASRVEEPLRIDGMTRVRAL